MNCVVALDLHLKKTQGIVMSGDGTVLKQDRFDTEPDALRKFLSGVPQGTHVTLESLGFCWPWIDCIEEAGFVPVLANPAKVRERTKDVKTDKIDAELLAHLTRMEWLPESYIPPKDVRMLRTSLRHRAALRKYKTSFTNRALSEMRKHGFNTYTNLATMKGMKLARTLGCAELEQDISIIDILERYRKDCEKNLAKSDFASRKPVLLLQSIKGVGLITSLTLYAEIVDIKRFPHPDKLAHYCGLVPTVHQSGEKPAWMGREVRSANKWLKWILIETAWSHIRFCPKGQMARAYARAYARKKNKKKAIKIVARKLVNIIWAVLTYEKEFDAELKDKRRQETPVTSCGQDRFRKTGAQLPPSPEAIVRQRPLIGE